VRDDLVGIKVWLSTTQGFNPQNITPIEYGVGSSVTIDNLQTNTLYYVRYAFISKIDPSVYTISNELSAKTYDELTRVYGELTNDPHYLLRSQNANTPDWSYATGTFRVWNYSTEVTAGGANTPADPKGPVYSVVANSATNGLIASINSTTGVFTATGWTGTARTAKVTFKAIYDGVEVLRDWEIVDGIGQDAPQLKLTSVPNNFVYDDVNATLSKIPQIVYTATLTNLTGTPNFTVVGYKADNTVIGNVAFTQSNNVITITNAQFHISNDIAYALVTATLGSVSDSDTVWRLNNGSDAIVVDISNPVVQLQADSAGAVDPTEYVDTGTGIEVYEGSAKLPVDNSSPYSAGSWTITNINSTGITPDTTPTINPYSIVYDQHNNMTQDTATIEYTISYKTKAGIAGTRVVTQSFSKSKQGVQGVPGSNAPVVNLTADKAAFIKQKNTGTITPATITITANVINVPSSTYAWYVDNTLQSGQTNSTFVVSQFSPTASKLIKCVVTGTGGVTTYDELSVYSIAEGDDSYIGGLTNENQTIQAQSDGTIYSGQLPISSQFLVVRGTEILTSGVAYSKVSETGMTSSINATTGAISVTAVSSTTATATYRATVTGTSIVLDKVLTVNVSKDGQNSVSYWMIASSSSVRKSTAGAFTPSTVTFSLKSKQGDAAPQDYSGRIIIATSTDGSTYTNQYTSASNETAYTYTIPANTRTIRARMYLAGGTTTLVDEEIVTVVDDGAAGAAGSTAKTVDIGNITNFKVNAGGIFSPTTATLNAVTQNISSPSYSWSITNATPSTSSASSVTLTPSGSGINFITVNLTVTDQSTGQTFSKSATLSVAYDGAVGQTGAAGIMSAFPTIYRWSTSQPSRPTPTSYTWSDGSYTAPSGWFTYVPTDTTPGNVLWGITIPLTVAGSTTTSPLNWNDTSYQLTARAYNGTNGAPGGPGAPGDPGAPGAATFVVTRTSGTGSPSNAEVVAVINRNPVAGDIVTVTATSTATSQVYRYTGFNWAAQTTYITGSLVVENSISGDRIIANSLSVSKIQSGTQSSAVGTGFFGFGLGTTARNYQTVGTFIANTGGFGLIAADEYTGYASDFIGASGVAGVALSQFALGGAFYNSTNTAGQQYNKFRTTSVFAYGTIAGLMKYNRRHNFDNNLGSDPVTQGQIGTSTVAGLFQGWGPGDNYVSPGSAPLNSQVRIATTDGIGIYVDIGDTYLRPTKATILGVGDLSAATWGGVGEIRATGNITAYYSSDSRLKTDIQDIKNALKIVSVIGGKTFNWSDKYISQRGGEDGYFTRKQDFGVIAQDVQTVFPIAVRTRDDGYLAVDYEKLCAVAFQAIKELQLEVNTLKELVNANTQWTDRTK
jgi:hypothetical protein